MDDGYVILPLLSVPELAQLIELYHQIYPPQVEGLQPLLRIGNPDENIKLHYRIGHTIAPALGKWFTPYAYNANHFLVKGAHDPNEFQLHQDWNVVDETRHIAAHIWIALQDVDEKNGGLFVVPASHHFFDNVRSGSCGIAFIERTEKVEQRTIHLRVRAGEAIVYQQSLFHGSHPNSTPHARLACLCSIRPADTPMIYFHRRNKREEAYSITPEILFKQIGDLEKGDNPINSRVIYSVQTGIKTVEIDNSLFEGRL